jgi:TP901 family phage tail tape measure protein
MSDTRLQLILELKNKALAPLRGIHAGSKQAADALKAARDQLRGLEKAQQDIEGLRKTRVQLRGQQRDLEGLQEKLRTANTSLAEHRERHKSITASLKTARESHSKLTQALQEGAVATPEFTRQLELARIRLLSSQGAYERSNSTLGKYRSQIKNAQSDVAQLTTRIGAGNERLQGFQQRLQQAGISTDRLAQQSRGYKSQIDLATLAIDRQKKALAHLKVQQERMAALKDQHAKSMVHTGMAVGAGMGMQMAGRQMARPVQTTLSAYSGQEDASVQLQASMMQADGSVPAEFAQIEALAKRLGDRLPGTTADFIELMTVLRKEGISAQAVLGGTGEAAALLGVQLKMPVTAAAAFAAKMQDATQATESEMLGLMDVLQKNAYLGADENYQLNGITAMAGAMGLLRLKGEAAYKALSPMLVMMNQAGMTDGGSAGNAINKVFEAGLDSKKLDKANELLKKAGIKLNFADKKGKFAGIENFFTQLEKLKKVGDNDVLKTEVFKELFGTDKENRQVLNNFIAKGYAGYQETVAKMEAQASLQQRVEKQLGTLTNVMEAAQSGFTNVLAAVGETIQGDAKGVINWIGEFASGIGAWVKEHPVLTANIMRVVAVLAALTVGLGVLLVPLALIIGKMMLVRFAFGMLGVKLPSIVASVRGLAGAFKAVGGASAIWMRLRASFSSVSGVLGLLRGSASGAFRLLTLPMRAFPITAAILGIGAAIFSIASRWDELKGYFNAGQWGALFGGIWQAVETGLNAVTFGMYGLLRGAVLSVGGTIKTLFLSTVSAVVDGAQSIWIALGGSVTSALGNIGAALVNWSPLGLLYQAITPMLSYLGLELPARFTEFGGNIIRGLINGITSMIGAVGETISNLAGSTIGFFKEKLGIHSPSRVFMAAGVNVGEGAAIGIDSTQGMVRKSAAGMVAAASMALPAMGMEAPGVQGAGAVAIDSRPPLSAPASASGRPSITVQGDNITLHIHAAPGMDTAAIGRAVEDALRRRDQAKTARMQSAFFDPIG